MGCKGTVVVDRIGVFNPLCGGIEGGTEGSDVVGNVSDVGVCSLAFLVLSSFHHICNC